MNRRSFLKLAAAAATVRGVDYLIGAQQSLPDIEFADDLVDLLLFLKTQTRLVCLGDTNHKRMEKSRFLSSRPHLERLGRGGFDSVLTEKSPDDQSYLNAVQEGEAAPQRDTSKKIAADDWISGARRDKIEEEHFQAIYGLPSPRFYNVDHRLTKEPPAALLAIGLASFLPITAQQLLLPQSLSSAAALEPALYVYGKVGNPAAVLAPLLDDTETARYINFLMGKQKGAALLVFGAGHFCGMGEHFGVPSLFGCLTKAGHNPIVVNIHASQEDLAAYNKEKKEEFHGIYRKPAVDFIAHAPKGSRIAFNDKRLEKTYLAARPPLPEEKTKQLSRRSLLRLFVA